MPLFRHREPDAGPEIDPAEAHRLVSAGEAWLLDVREPDEWAAGRAPGAVHVPLGALPVRAGELPRDRVVVAVCRSGNRSRVATGLLGSLGLDARNLRGGMRDWAAAGLPVERDGGQPGAVA